MSQKLLLITPPYHAGVVECAGKWPHLGLVYVAGHCREAGFEVEIYDAMTKGHDLHQIQEHIARVQPDFVGSTAYTSSLYAAADVLRAAKEVDPRIITILGGIHANFCFEEVLKEFPAIDYVVRGEGEVTAPELLQCLASGGDPGKVKGIAYRTGDGTVVATPTRPLISNLDALLPAWDLVNWLDYTYNVIPGSRLGLVSSSRGCVHGCSFCSQHKFWRKTYRARSPEAFVTELEYLRDRYGVNVVMLSDEWPTRDRERWKRILDLLRERQVRVYLLIETCVGDIVRDEDILDKYREAGVLHIYVGVEATSQGRLEEFKKDIKCEESYRALKLIREAGMISECSFVLGTPGETRASIEETLKLAQYYNPDFAHFLLLAPWPYADLYEDVKEYITEKDYSKYNFVNPVIRPAAMSEKEIMQAMISCYRRYYTRKLTDYANEPNPVRRDYLLRSMQVIVDNSFLHQHARGLGDMPKAIRKLLSKTLQSNLNR
jgi:anaerobic magnesium-protoporphyrin IX monomethyl ester cyclase